jgi:hypothetical protein
MLNNYNNSISFNARLGSNLKTFLLNNEFNGNTNQVEKFEKELSDKFVKYLDDNTFIEMKSNGKFEIFNPAFPKLKMPIKLSPKTDTNITARLLNTHYLTYNRAEYILFQRFISSQKAKGKTLETIRDIGEKLLGKERKPYFTDLIEAASRILKENPKSKLNETDFSIMNDKILRELIEDPSFQALWAKSNH